jgi:two-component system, OmpR family, response regulator QseB
MRVLLIEDDELLGDGLKAGVEQTGYVVDWVRDGDAAQRAFERETYDLAVLDLGLPKRPGIEVLRWLRRRGNEVPVLILTATDGVADRVTALDAGADDYVSKPFDLDEVCARLRALHRRAAGFTSPVIRYGEIEIDPAARSVMVDKFLVPLSPKEFAILQLLAENAGKPVPRGRLMSSIYGWDDEIGSNVLEVHVHHLRKKLPTLTVKTVRGVGYRLQ